MNNELLRRNLLNVADCIKTLLVKLFWYVDHVFEDFRTRYRIFSRFTLIDFLYDCFSWVWVWAGKLKKIQCIWMEHLSFRNKNKKNYNYLLIGFVSIGRCAWFKAFNSKLCSSWSPLNLPHNGRFQYIDTERSQW